MKLKNILYTLLIITLCLLYSSQNATLVNIQIITDLIQEHLAESSHTPPSPGDSIFNEDVFTVTKVIDGDTFWINDKEKVRLIGIDAPETRNTRHKPKHPFGEKSKQFLSELIMDKEVTLVYDVGKYDRYKRLLAYVYLADGTFVNKELVKEGYATIMTVQPNITHADLFLEMQQDARENKKGIWAEEE